MIYTLFKLLLCIIFFAQECVYINESMKNKTIPLHKNKK